MRRARRLATLALLACCRGDGAPAGAAALASVHREVRLSSQGGLPEEWVSCAASCARAAGPRMTMLGTGAGDGRLRWDVPGDAAATRALERLAYVVHSDGDGSVLTLTSRDVFQGVRLVHRYVLSDGGDTLDATLQVPAGARLVLESGAAFVPEPLPGFASMYDGVDAVRVAPAGQVRLTGVSRGAGGVAIAGGEWVGVRNRFWALLLRPTADLTVEVRATIPDRPRLDVQPGPDTPTLLHLVLYAGPVERRRLVAVDPVLAGLLLPGLWDWLRLLGFGMRHLLERWHDLVGNYGVAILLLSLSVKVLMWPLTRVAERWQREVNRLQSQLEPELALVRRDFRGEEAHRRTLAVYRRHGVSPLFPVRSVLGVLIQIPVFIAAFDMLGWEFGLNGASFLWIADLALPDRWAALPVTVPFAGGYLNLLPFLMTGFTVLAARVQAEPSLSAALRTGQRRHLYVMAAAFFVLLYAFPAGMVLYWTSNNFWYLLKVLAVRAVR
jgi:YidC/Oxa1 family membrane protein insertase